MFNGHDPVIWNDNRQKSDRSPNPGVIFQILPAIVNQHVEENRQPRHDNRDGSFYQNAQSDEDEEQGGVNGRR